MTGSKPTSQNRWPSLRFDLLAVNSLLRPFVAQASTTRPSCGRRPSGRSVYEPMIRRAAGLGRPAASPTPITTSKLTRFCDMLIIGAGPAGLAAALTAARSGARVILCEQDFVIGGRLLADDREIDGAPGNAWAASVSAELRGQSNVRVLPRTCVFGVYDGQTYGALERVADHIRSRRRTSRGSGFGEIVARRAVLAGGAIERPLVFPGNDRPGVMMARRCGPISIAMPCGRANAWRCSPTMTTAGAPPRLWPARNRSRRAHRQPARGGRSSDIAVCGRARHCCGARERDQGFALAARDHRHDAQWHGAHRRRHVGDVRTAGTRRRADLPSGGTPGMERAAGRIPTRTNAARHGRRRRGERPDAAAGLPPRRRRGRTRRRRGDRLYRRRRHGSAADDETFAVTPFWHIERAARRSSIFRTTSPPSDVELAEREGFRAVEHLKRYTTLGMATDQGKTANVNGLAIMAELTGKTIPSRGTTSSGRLTSPVAIGALAGPSPRRAISGPTRLTRRRITGPQEQGAIFVETGPWLRAQYFPRAGETRLARYASTAKSTPCASASASATSRPWARSTSRAPTPAFSSTGSTSTHSRTWRSASARYGVMLREDGFVMDDGTTSRLGRTTTIFMTTTTANAVRVMQHMEFCHQVLWPELDVQFVSATEQWAQYVGRRTASARDCWQNRRSAV